MIFSVNYFNMDEDSGSIDGERILDRMAAIPFEEEVIISCNSCNNNIATMAAMAAIGGCHETMAAAMVCRQP